MSNGWVTVQLEEVKESYKFESHSPEKISKRIPWLMCKYCGLIYLNNKFTKWCIKTGCMHELHNGYKLQRKRTK